MKNNLEEKMTEPTKEQVEKWRKECFDLAIKASIDFHEYENHYFKIAYEKGYLAAKKLDFKKIKTLKEQLAEAVGLLRYVQHPKNTDEWVDCGKEVDRFLEKQDKENKGKK